MILIIGVVITAVYFIIKIVHDGNEKKVIADAYEERIRELEQENETLRLRAERTFDETMRRYYHREIEGHGRLVRPWIMEGVDSVVAIDRAVNPFFNDREWRIEKCVIIGPGGRRAFKVSGNEAEEVSLNKKPQSPAPCIPDTDAAEEKIKKVNAPLPNTNEKEGQKKPANKPETFSAENWFSLHAEIIKSLCPEGTKSFVVPSKYFDGLNNDETLKILRLFVEKHGARQAYIKEEGMYVMPAIQKQAKKGGMQKQ